MCVDSVTKKKKRARRFRTRHGASTKLMYLARTLLPLLAAAACTPAAVAATPTHRIKHLVTAATPDYRHAELAACSVAPSSPHFQLCDEACSFSDAAHASLGPLPTTPSGVPSVDVVQALLAAAWSALPDAPSVDLFVRTGCHGAREARLLLQSVELFWPHGVGSVVLVLDASDRHLVRHLVPYNARHRYVVHHEHAPCMPGRVFNQVSYLMADHYASADVIVTIDSDCVLHSPVMPRLLFREGRIRLPHSTAFQRDVWRPLVERFVGAGAYTAHTMVSQPVVFHRSTFAAYRRWYADTHNGSCYLDGVASALDQVDSGSMTLFCWMCQLSAFLGATGTGAHLYDLVDVDVPTAHPYQRLALHVTYELDDEDGGADYDESSRRAVRQGLCWSLGDAIQECAGASTAYVDRYLFRYHDYDWVASEEVKQATQDGYRGEVRRWLEGAW